MLVVTEVLVISVSLYLAMRSLILLIRKGKNIYFLHLLFFFVFVLPLLMDYFIGLPEYRGRFSVMYGFFLSSNDYSVRMAYSVYVLFS